WVQVHQKALRAAGTLMQAHGAAPGVHHGDAVAVLAGDPALIAPAVQGVWLAGGSVTMLHQPTPRIDLATWVADTVVVLEMIGAKLVLLGPPFDGLAPLLDQRAIGYRHLADLDDPATPPLAAPVPAGEDDTVLLQLTSGSTAQPKAVRITHGNLYANLMAMAQVAGLNPETDVLVSWLPLFHDMGMVGCLTAPMALGLELVKATPADFLSRPLLWAELISRHRGTVTAAPNFGYALLARRLAGTKDEFDLSTLRFALNGAEPIDPAAVRAFTAAGARFGLPENCMVCAYGMAETTLGVSFAPRGIGMQVDTVDAEALESQRRAVPAGPEARRVRAFPRLGPPLPGLQAHVADDNGRPLGEREVGLIRLRGESVTREYLTVAGPEPAQDPDGWLDTGDEGYLADGDVVVCGRRKDVIIMGGRNVYPTDIERAAGQAAGVRAGNVVAVRIEAGARRESFAVAVESHCAGDADAERTLRREVTSRVVDAVGLRPGAVVVLPPSSLPKTPSGKLRRAAARGRIAEHLPQP
ncbi:MAG: fatty acyl-AMP ligase, partial [Pseudonocardiaceae bacterium]